MADGYTETFTPEEEATLAPPAAEPSPTPATTEGEPQAAAPAPAPSEPAADAGASPAPAGGQGEDERFRQFMQKHAGKTPEELARLAFQQEGRANQSGFAARQSQQTLDQIRERATAATQRAADERARIAREREQFGERLTNDPDAATRDLHERLMSQDEQRISGEEFSARRDEAVAIAATVPGFNLESATAFGAEMNYSPEELAKVTDVRDLATLHFASLSARLIKAGVLDLNGNYMAQPGAVAATDPRLTAPAAPTTLSSAAARAGGQSSTVDTQLADLANMSDKDWDAFMKANPTGVEDLLRTAG